MLEFKDKVVYQIYIKSFKDYNNDGFGDIRGITSKLNYLSYLGVDYLWITPFYVSPQVDNGYDIADYYNIDKAFGTMQDFKNLVKTAKKYNIKLVLDMVFNHTSTQHIWFKNALKGEEKYQKFYFFKNNVNNKPPTNWKSKFGGNAWEYVKELDKWYLHLFDKTQADLNWDNPDVREEIKKILLFWKKQGVDGFRFDVINLISKPIEFKDDLIGDGRKYYTDGPNIHKYIQELVADTGIGNCLTVAELSSTSLNNCVKYTKINGKEFKMAFNFHHLKVDYKDNDKWSIEKFQVKKLQNVISKWQLGLQENNSWPAVFLNNHDQPRSVSRFGNDKNFLVESAKMLAMFIHFLRGTPYIYQGEEVGMTNVDYEKIDSFNDIESKNYYKILLESGKTCHEALDIIKQRSRDNGRTPVQWNSSQYGGFSAFYPWIKENSNYDKINIESQIKDENSVLQFYRKLIELRKRKKIISEGEINFYKYQDFNNVISYYRTLGNQKLIVICNFDGTTKYYNCDDKDIKFGDVLLSNYKEVKKENFDILLYPYMCVALLIC